MIRRIRLALWFQFVGAACLAALLMLFACRADAQNILSNPGFESTYLAVSPTSPGNCTGYVASSWYDNTGWDAAASVVYSHDTSTFYAGSSSQKVVVNGGFSQLQQNLTFQAGRYSATIYVKALTPTWVSIGLRELGSPYTYYGVTSFRATSTWSPVTVTGITPSVAGTLVASTGAPGTVWFDSASAIFQGVNPTPTALTPPAGSVPLTYFGVTPLHLAIEGGTIPWPSISFGTVRQHDAAPSWAQAEPSNGTFSWSALDAFVSAAAANGQQVIYCFSQTPTWATTDTNIDQYGYKGGDGVPSNISYWTTFVSALVTRYKGKIAAYEIWNEPNSGFWDGNQAQLEHLEQTAAPIIRSTDPSALVLSPAITIAENPSDLSYYELYLEAGGGANSDVMSCHLYDPSPEDDLQCVPALKSLLATYGFAGKPLWNTETAWGYAGVGTGNGQQAMAQTVEFLPREYILEWALGISNFDWYGWSDISNVGVRQDGSGNWTVLTGGAIAYQQVESWLNAAAMNSCSMDGNGNWVAAITSPSGYTGEIVWNNDQTFNYPVPTGASYEYDVAGDHTSLAGISTVSVGASPVLIEVPPVTPAPVVSPSSGSYVGSVNVTITDSLTAAAIRYTTDGTDPATSSTAKAYPSGGFALNASATVTAVATANEYANSSEAFDNLHYYSIGPAINYHDIKRHFGQQWMVRVFGNTNTCRNSGIVPNRGHLLHG